jgi:hypothetical protein
VRVVGNDSVGFDHHAEQYVLGRSSLMRRDYQLRAPA